MTATGIVCTVMTATDTGRLPHPGPPVAAALAVPSVVTYLDSDVDRWAPLDRTRHRAVRTRQERDGGLAAVRAAVHELLGAT